ncbi:MAG: hypothetical protein N3E47_02180 [Candidatus Bathyarchaeota archaeon]|nr:hypothetical protein [Candidatus Bathyarchaeota archaeon]
MNNDDLKSYGTGTWASLKLKSKLRGEVYPLEVLDKRDAERTVVFIR